MIEGFVLVMTFCIGSSFAIVNHQGSFNEM